MERYGSENVIIIKDSNTVDVRQLDPEKAYIQITYVEPYFEPYEIRYRQTHFDRNFNISKYIFFFRLSLTGVIVVIINDRDNILYCLEVH